LRPREKEEEGGKDFYEDDGVDLSLVWALFEEGKPCLRLQSDRDGGRKKCRSGLRKNIPLLQSWILEKG